MKKHRKLPTVASWRKVVMGLANEIERLEAEILRLKKENDPSAA